MNIFGIGLPEMALIFIVALLIFGPKKLPEIGKSLGKAIKSFQDASKEFETEFKREAEQIEKVVKEPMNAVLESPKAIASAQSSPSTEAQEVGAADTQLAKENEDVSDVVEGNISGDNINEDNVDRNSENGTSGRDVSDAPHPMSVETADHQEEQSVS